MLVIASTTLYSGFDDFKPRLKIGVIFPLNWEFYRKWLDTKQIACLTEKAK